MQHKMLFLKRLLSSILGDRLDEIPFTIKPMEEDGLETNGAIISHNMDGLSEDEREALAQAASELSEIPLFEGHVKYGYSLEGVADETQCCPRCRGSAERRYANFIYMSQKAMRVMYAPAGFFCTKCPTVSVDEDLLRTGVADKQHHYKQVVGIDYGKKRDAEYLRKWNGKDLIYIFDEDQNLLDITTTPPKDAHLPASHPSGRHKSNKDKRKRQEKNARKRNRNR